MTQEEIISLVDYYTQKLVAKNVVPKRIETNKTFGDYTYNTTALLQHALHLCLLFKGHTAADKQNRHLTAIQMCLSFAGMYTLDELMAHNKYGIA